MILGFRANINNDSHRIFITRLINFGVNFKGIPSCESNCDDRDSYSFIFDSENDFINAKKVKRSMIDQYKDIPLYS